MKRIYSHIIYTCLTITLLAGCKSDYPYIEYEGNPGKVEFDNIESLIPIMVAIDDPLYKNHTRGAGVFGNATDENLTKDIHVYAFYTPEGIAGVPSHSDYNARMDSKDYDKYLCLIDDTDNEGIGHGKRARLNQNMPSFLQWADGDNVYYNNTYPQYRYKFFAYHIDDAAEMNNAPNRYADYVSYDIEIDGTQDLMCGFARPTNQQLEKIESLSSPSNKDFINNLEELTYSTESARRDLIPVFEMEHLLTYMKFKLKAERIGDTLDPEIEKVRVKNIIIKNAPNKGEFIVAAENTNRLGVVYTDSSNYYMPTRNTESGIIETGSNTGFSNQLTPTEEEQEVGAGFLIPPSQKYELEMVCYIDEGNDKSGYVQDFNLELPEGFKPGHQYEITVKVYGPRNIRLQWGSIEWKEGDDIIIDEEG